MKRLLLSLSLALTAALGAQAQTLPAIANGGFETWALSGQVNTPTGWTTSDQIYSNGPFPFPFTTAVQTNDKHGGQSALKLQGANLGVASLPAFLILGAARDFDSEYPGGMACAARPAALQFWYKYQGSVNDTTFAAVMLTRGSGAGRVEIGGGGLALTPNASTADYRLGQVPIIYTNTSALAPDSLYNVFVGNNGSANGILFLDDLTLTNTVTAAREPMLAGALVAYPNPSQDGWFKVRAEQDHDLVAGTLTVADATGRTVLRQPPVAPGAVVTGRPVDLRGQAPGVYTLRLATPRGTVVRRLMLN
ncbi:T9SS type A sorting domain-containing protein [Hymenobacter gummosus]|uniref:T9SS type A sorting domain-containing protein n=1 Tax=Hymenobacter gummosus TaxID=1776032 RepID=A0A431TY79_9BACT|nr:T9SS type A sorting domain-containing protein [Hymenobacter gummosus]RTQ46551.1 T9SS type A sorting domain-containing protein [Hymenobacter gummosus]